MRIVATSDTHHFVDVNFIPDGDVFIHAGDLMRTGYPDDFAMQLKWLKQLPHKTKLLIPGNHDFHLKVYPGPALQQLRDVGVWVIGLPGNTNYETYKLENGMTVLGLPYVTDLPRWAFNIKEKKLKKLLARHSYNNVPDIIVSHMPVKGFLDTVNGERRGSMVYNDYLENNSHPVVGKMPAHWICGHIHEGYGTEDGPLFKAGRTKFYNVAMCDRSYKHVNPPMVIDL